MSINFAAIKAAALADLAKIESFLELVGHDSEQAAGILVPLADAAEALSGAASLIPITNAAGAALEASGAAETALGKGDVQGAETDAAAAKSDVKAAGG